MLTPLEGDEWEWMSECVHPLVPIFLCYLFFNKPSKKPLKHFKSYVLKYNEPRLNGASDRAPWIRGWHQNRRIPQTLCPNKGMKHACPWLRVIMHWSEWVHRKVTIFLHHQQTSHPTFFIRLTWILQPLLWFTATEPAYCQLFIVAQPKENFPKSLHSEVDPARLISSRCPQREILRRSLGTRIECKLFAIDHQNWVPGSLKQFLVTSEIYKWI